MSASSQSRRWQSHEPEITYSDRHNPAVYPVRLFDHTYGDNPVTYDFVFVSGGLAPQVRKVQVDPHTRASDHQPVFVEFGNAAMG